MPKSVPAAAQDRGLTYVDATAMRGGVDVHCYTPAEFERKRDGLRIVRETAEHGLELLPAPL